MGVFLFHQSSLLFIFFPRLVEKKLIFKKNVFVHLLSSSLLDLHHQSEAISPISSLTVSTTSSTFLQWPLGVLELRLTPPPVLPSHGGRDLVGERVARCRGGDTGRRDKRGQWSCSCRQDKRLLQVFTDWTGKAAASSCVGRPPNGSSA